MGDERRNRKEADERAIRWNWSDSVQMMSEDVRRKSSELKRKPKIRQGQRHLKNSYGLAITFSRNLRIQTDKSLGPRLVGLDSGPYTILIHFLIKTSFNYDYKRLELLYKHSYNIRLNLIKLTVPYFLGYPVYPAIRKLRYKVMRLQGISAIGLL